VKRVLCPVLSWKLFEGIGILFVRINKIKNGNWWTSETERITNQSFIIHCNAKNYNTKSNTMKSSILCIAAATLSSFIGQEVSAAHLRASSTTRERKIGEHTLVHGYFYFYLSMIKYVIAVASDNNNLSTFPAYRDFDYFECDVSLTEGITFEGEEDTLESTLNCETDPDHEFGDVVFSLEGNTDEFFHGLDLSHGDVRIKVPIDAVSDHDIIEINDTSSTQIVITYTGDDRRKLVQSPTIGSMFVLVIRVSDDTDSTGRKKVAQSASKLTEDIFDWRNNNLVSIH